MTRVKRRPRGTPTAPTLDERTRAVHEEIKAVIVGSSLDMTKSVVRTVKRRGSAASMKFLWSIAGIMQEQAAAKSDPSTSSLQTLVDKLGLYRKPGGETVDDPDSKVKS